MFFHGFPLIFMDLLSSSMILCEFFSIFMICYSFMKCPCFVIFLFLFSVFFLFLISIGFERNAGVCECGFIHLSVWTIYALRHFDNSTLRPFDTSTLGHFEFIRPSGRKRCKDFDTSDTSTLFLESAQGFGAGRHAAVLYYPVCRPVPPFSPFSQELLNNAVALLVMHIVNLK